MARNETSNTKQVGQALDAGLWERFVAFCKGRRQTIRRNLEEAIQRHMANPPPLDPPPLPPVTAPPPPVTASPPPAAEKPARKKRDKK